MLQLILGRSGSGKTTALYAAMHEAAKNSTTPLILLVPEQASFDNERRLLAEFGPILSQRVQVLSFTRLADTVFRQIGGITEKRMDTTMSLLLMHQAVHSIADSLSLYRRQVDNPDYLRDLLDFSTECKQCAITPDVLFKTANTLPVGVLRSKAEEMSLIFGTYEALIKQSALTDPQDTLTVLADRLHECGLFDGANLYIDSFSGFTEQEMLVLERLLPRVAQMTVCLCTDTATPSVLPERFSTASRTAVRLRDAASRHHVPIAPVQYLTENRRTNQAALAALEAAAFTPSATAYDGNADEVCITPCTDRAEECRTAAREIRRLLREEGGYCREFTVVVRDTAAYADLLESALRREGLPCTMDMREPILTKPLITLIESALAAVDGWDSADILRLVKTGLTGFSASSGALLENYVFLWNIRGKQWKLPFTAHPNGMNAKTDARSQKRLAYLNLLRRRLAEPLMHLQTRLSDTRTGKEFATAVWSFLQELRIPRAVRLSVARLKACGEQALADQQARIWEYAVDLLDKFAALPTPCTIRQFANLWHLAVSSADLGSIPPTLDGVNFGAADRIRYTAPKTVFILGANEGVFPAYPQTGGLLCNRERQQLITAGLPMMDDADHRSMEERFYAYTALAAPSERLYISYVGVANGEEQQPSVLVDTVKTILPNHRKGAPCDGLSESAADAFTTLSSLWRENTPLGASYRAVFADLPEFSGRIKALQRAEEGFSIQDRTLARRLFGKNLRLSPTQVETYHRCRFAYFCQYGLRIKPRNRAVLGAAEAGTLTHYIMSILLPVYAKQGYTACTKETIHNDVTTAVEAYVEEYMGGLANADSRFRGLMTHLIRFCEELMWRVVAELRDSRFAPVDYELPIGRTDENGNGIPPWILKTPDGSTIQVQGTVDRVDVFREGDTAYIRIIDYKTGTKTFDLSEVLGGLNLQMLIYLFSICENGQARYGTTSPAGILYLPAQLPVVKIDRDLPEDTLELKRLKVMKMNGLLIDDPNILKAMEADLAGVFIPASVLKSGEFSQASSLASLEQFGQIRRHIQRLLTDMADHLHRGAIDVLPTGGEMNGCLYCPYHDICCHETGDPVRDIAKRSLAEALNDLEKEEYDE